MPISSLGCQAGWLLLSEFYFFFFFFFFLGTSAVTTVMSTWHIQNTVCSISHHSAYIWTYRLSQVWSQRDCSVCMWQRLSTSVYKAELWIHWSSEIRGGVCCRVLLFCIIVLVPVQHYSEVSWKDRGDMGRGNLCICFVSLSFSNSTLWTLRESKMSQLKMQASLALAFEDWVSFWAASPSSHSLTYAFDFIH